MFRFELNTPVIWQHVEHPVYAVYLQLDDLAVKFRQLIQHFWIQGQVTVYDRFKHQHGENVRATGWLEFKALVQGDDTAGHIVVSAAFETRLFHHLFERFLVRVHANGFGKIAVTVFVIGDKLAHFGQYIK